jgi:DNA-directed RNA polymerase specialized sigma24 family protein
MEIDLPDPGKNPEQEWQSREMEGILRDEVSKLGMVCRRAIELCMLDECPQLEVAQSMNLSVATMKSRVFRGKRILARTLSRRLGAQHCAMDMPAGRRMSCEM